MDSIQDSLLKSMQILIDANNKNLKFDYTTTGQVLAINNDTITVAINGQPIDCKVMSGEIFQINDIVLVKVPQNNFNQLYVEGKLGYASINNTATDHNHDDRYYTKIQVDEKTVGINDKNYVFSQLTPQTTWNIIHNLGKFPSVTIVDSAGSVVIGEINYMSQNQVTIMFESAFSGVAYLN